MISILLSGSSAKKDGGVITQESLQNDLKVGEVLRLDKLAKTTNGQVCVLQPYQPYLSEHAKECPCECQFEDLGYQAAEGHWAFVVVDAGKVALSRFKRSEALDILGGHEIQQQHVAELPKRFASVECASLQTAVVAKIKLRNRVFLVLGQMR